MQEFHSIPGLAGRIFGTGGDQRRLREYPGIGGGGGAVPDPPAKCPRCESTNTKFCYYNNYNLSQPRHFCKSCRRYWTKGGVLRNVPVGGGCRKSSSKRSSKKSRDRRRSAAESSSDCSSLTAATTTATTDAAAARSIAPPAASDGFDPVAAEQQTIFPHAGTFTSLMASSPAFAGLNFSDPLPTVAEDGRAIDPVDLRMDWPAAMDDPAIFDIAGGGDPGGYWNQVGGVGGGHWTDTDPNLYLP